jgi:hypothetical protein
VVLVWSAPRTEVRLRAGRGTQRRTEFNLPLLQKRLPAQVEGTEEIEGSRTVNRNELIRQLDWLRDTVLAGYEQRGDNESIFRTKMQIDDIEWRLETTPPRAAPSCGWRKSYRLHDPNCANCRRSGGEE